MTHTIHTVTMTEAEMKAYEAGRKAGLREAAKIADGWATPSVRLHGNGGPAADILRRIED